MERAGRWFAEYGGASVADDRSAQTGNQATLNGEFAKRDGARLTLGGRNYRYGSPNIEWLGIEACGPDDALGSEHPSHLEVDDVLAVRRSNFVGIQRCGVSGWSTST